MEEPPVGEEPAHGRLLDSQIQANDSVSLSPVVDHDIPQFSIDRLLLI